MAQAAKTKIEVPNAADTSGDAPESLAVIDLPATGSELPTADASEHQAVRPATQDNAANSNATAQMSQPALESGTSDVKKTTNETATIASSASTVVRRIKRTREHHSQIARLKLRSQTSRQTSLERREVPPGGGWFGRGEQPIVMTLRTIEFSDGRRVQQLLPRTDEP